MKNNSLIIDLRSQLPAHTRYASGTSTAVMRAVWLLLWRPFIILAGLMSLQTASFTALVWSFWAGY